MSGRFGLGVVSCLGLLVILVSIGCGSRQVRKDGGVPPADDPAFLSSVESCNYGSGVACASAGSMLWTQAEEDTTLDPATRKSRYALARDYFRRACNMGVTDSCLLFAQCVYEGKGGPKNVAEAEVAAGRSCAADNALGCALQAVILLKDIGTEDAIQTGAEALFKSCNLGYKPSCELIESVMKDMTD